ncbi:MAG: SUMF1/EgtB/PvdO family nonheme iron enzyme [Bacteroidia bacterium]|nr:SUMF1/EgtB/PvdO family nonheme iron enzyme [Bacteroidia bacterium]
MKKKISFLLTAGLFFILGNLALANGVEVANVQRLTNPNRDKIAFELSWQNSWNVTGTPGNHDAVWVFIKYRPCGGSGDWDHALLSMAHVDHVLHPSLTLADTISNLNRLGATGDYNSGAMIRRANTGTGNMVSLPCTLKVVGGAGGATFSNVTDYDIRVFAIEMVYIPEGVFAIGDNGSTNYKFQTTNSNSAPLPVTSEAALPLYDTYCGNRTIPANYPKGYGSFYLMKYEVSLGQYTDFLNTLSGATAAQRYPGFDNNYRHRLSVSGGQYVTARQDRAANYLNWDDVLSYLDWSALRPMTEMEYEKACKGNGVFGPLAYAWGDAAYVEALNVTSPENGTETVTDVNANMHFSGTNINILGGDNATPNLPLTQGPIGCGIFARDNTQTRETTGGSYYGVMELSGNVGEPVITTYGTSGCGSASTYDGIWGDGRLTVGGLWNTANWPVADFNSIRPNGWRGGAWDYSDIYCRVSDRYYTLFGGGQLVNRNRSIGGRGAR